MPKTLLKESELLSFAKAFDTSSEDDAVCSRGDFLRAFPLDGLDQLSLDDYVIGKGTASFCARVEAKTKAWANIQGATATKFGIYYGKTKSDSKKKYRYTKKFGTSKNKAFEAVKAAILKLIEAGYLKDFHAIDINPLSQMFKAKILSLYFPNDFLNICSSDHIYLISSELGFPDDSYTSEHQHWLCKEKLKSKVAKDWTNPKFMSFLYAKFIREDLSSLISIKVKKPSKKRRSKVDFEALQARRDAIGKASEEFAIEWEKNRLIGLGYENLVQKIEDRSEVPSYGYDLLSHSAPDQKRYIEVKSLRRDRKENCFSFFLSENELEVSKSDKHCSEYYFYLVKYGKNGNPQCLIARHADDIYFSGEISPCAFIVRLDLDDK